MTLKWQNWSGSVECDPAAIKYPTSQNEIIEIVKECQAKKLKIRVVGSGHSFTPLVQTSGVLVNLDFYSGVETIDQEKMQATVLAGTKIKELGELLFAQGLAQPNLGDIDVQSIAGAISTGTHGSGATLGSLSTQVCGLTIISASGEVIECSAEHEPELFRAAQVSMGALGIISKVKLQLVPAFKLHYEWKRLRLSEALFNIEKHVTENRNFEFFWFPYSDYVQAKFMNITSEPAKTKSFSRRFNETVLENGAFWLLSEFCRIFPKRSAGVSKLAANLISGGSDVNYAHRIFATPRLVKFQEMEYSLPRQYLAKALVELDAEIRRQKFRVHFPVECRFVQADDIYLSPANERDSAYIAVHMYRGMEYKPYFAAMEAIFLRYGGRPHWAKHHSRTAADFASHYPHWQEFQAARQRLDPGGLFLNDYLATVLRSQAAGVRS